MPKTFCMHKLRPGDCAVVYELKNPASMRRRLQDLGLIENTVVECLGIAPGGAISAYLIRGAVIAIRAEDGKKIRVVRYIPENGAKYETNA